MSVPGPTKKLKKIIPAHQKSAWRESALKFVFNWQRAEMINKGEAMRIIEFCVRITAATASAIILAACVELERGSDMVQFDAQATQDKPEDYKIVVSPNGNSVTIIARDTLRYTLLDALRAEHGIEIRPSGVPDKRISINISNTSLDKAISQLLPEGSRYVLRIGDRTPSTGSEYSQLPAMRGGRVASPVSGERPGRDEQSRLQTLKAGERSTRMGDVSETQPILVPQDIPQTKLASQLARPVFEARPAVHMQNSVLLNFLMTDQNEIKLLSTIIIKGPPPPKKISRDPFIFVVQNSHSEILDFGSFPDPLVVRGYGPGESHTWHRAPQGIFSIYLPSWHTEFAKIQSLTLEIYDIRDADPPPTLNEISLTKAIRDRRKAKRIAQIQGSVLFHTIWESAQ